MSKEDDNNKVIQSNNTVEGGDIAGRDINKINYYRHEQRFNFYLFGQPDYQSFLKLLHQITQVPIKLIEAIIKNDESGSYNNEALEKGLSLLELFKSSLLTGALSGITVEYEQIVLGYYNNNLDEEYLKNIIKAAGVCVAKLEFGKAHKLFEDALEKMNTSDKNYPLFYKEFLITGFIHYSRQNDMSGLRALLTTKRDRSSTVNETIDLIIANVFQEICSRDTDIEGLKKAVQFIERIYQQSSEATKPSLCYSLGLAYRRLGERTGIEQLEKAISLFEEGLRRNDGNANLEIQLKDHLAITLIRVFEFVHKEEYLANAELLLNECLKLLTEIRDPRECMLRPRVLNNLGNVYKQRVLNFEDVLSAGKAISHYTEAENYWSEKNSSYEWGLLQKNIAETKLAVGKVLNDPALYLESLDYAMASMKYRDLKNSAYQWAKSSEILFSSVIALGKQHCRLIKPAIRKKLIRYAKIVQTNKYNWDPNNFVDFLSKAAQTLLILSDT